MPTYLFTQAYFFLKPSADDSLPASCLIKMKKTNYTLKPGA
jgi:hypothetical protein